MTIKRWLRTQGSAIFTSTAFRSFRRRAAALQRRLQGKQPVVHYFHQADDPYSDLAARALPQLSKNYAIELVTHLVPPPDAGAAPDPERLQQWSLRDASELANALGLTPALWQQIPSSAALTSAQTMLAGISDANEFAAAAARVREAFVSESSDSVLAGTVTELGTDVSAALAQAAALRKNLGHYLGAMFYFEGEWYWGLDRLPFLEQRLQPFARHGQVQPFVDRLEASIVPGLRTTEYPAVADDGRPVVDLFFSLRSPYSWLVLPRAIALAATYNARLQLRFVLPMVMRGLPIPEAKRLYIVTDTKREAERLGLPFGRIADPVGKPTERGLAVLHHALQKGQGEAFALSFMRGVFADGISARSDAGLLKICKRAGLSADDMRAALADPGWRSVAETNRAIMLAEGIWGVPAFRVNEGSTHWGQDRLWLLEKQLQAACANVKPSAAAPSAHVP
jgi:2-hydroxychromene-2-carboxylate isomerase